MLAALPILLGLLKGPLADILARLVPDPDLRSRLQIEIERGLAAEGQARLAAARDIIVAEATGSHPLAALWRPLLMVFILLLLALYGVLLPALDLFRTAPLPFHPRWHEIPDEMWSLLKLGVGGYIGGRSAEKAVAILTRARN